MEWMIWLLRSSWPPRRAWAKWSRSAFPSFHLLPSSVLPKRQALVDVEPGREKQLHSFISELRSKMRRYNALIEKDQSRRRVLPSAVCPGTLSPRYVVLMYPSLFSIRAAITRRSDSLSEARARGTHADKEKIKAEQETETTASTTELWSAQTIRSQVLWLSSFGPPVGDQLFEMWENYLCSGGRWALHVLWRSGRSRGQRIIKKCRIHSEGPSTSRQTHWLW